MEPLVMDETPDVISIGWRCVELGWSFWWPPFSLHPILSPPGAKDIVCNVRGHIPYIDRASGNVSVPAASGPWVAMPPGSVINYGEATSSPVPPGRAEERGLSC